MMSRMGVGLFATLVAVCLAGPANAQSVVVLGDFEGGSLDGWAGSNDGGTTAVLTSLANATIASTGSSGLRIVGGAPAGGGPTGNFWMLNYDNNDLATLGADVASHRLLKADVTFVGTQFDEVTNNWAQWNKIAINTDSGWQEVNPSADPGWNAGQGNLRYTYTWDLSGVNVPAAPTFFQIHMSCNFDRPSFGGSGQPPIPAFFVDNIRLEEVPEPGSLALAGVAMGAIGLMRRRR